jgi:predicted nuclease with TOPRIM domain
MAEITLESLYHLVENMADYITTKVATKEELGELRGELGQVRVRVDLLTIRLTSLEERFEQFRVEVNNKFDQILEGMDGQAGQLDG